MQTSLQEKGSSKLILQSNGWIVLEVRGARFVHWGPARGLRYRLEYKSIKGWHPISGWFEDDMTARQVLRESNERSPRIAWRLVAFNDDGEVALPKGWEGPRS